LRNFQFLDQFQDKLGTIFISDNNYHTKVQNVYKVATIPQLALINIHFFQNRNPIAFTNFLNRRQNGITRYYIKDSQPSNQATFSDSQISFFWWCKLEIPKQFEKFIEVDNIQIRSFFVY